MADMRTAKHGYKACMGVVSSIGQIASSGEVLDANASRCGRAADCIARIVEEGYRSESGELAEQALRSMGVSQCDRHEYLIEVGLGLLCISDERYVPGPLQIRRMKRFYRQCAQLIRENGDVPEAFNSL